MKRIAYAPNHGSHRGRRPSKRLCRECHMPATHAEIEQRPAAVLHLDGSIHRFMESVVVYWCAGHGDTIRRAGRHVNVPGSGQSREGDQHDER